MSLFDAYLTERRPWIRVGDAYEITKKPRELDKSTLEAVPFVPMAAIPQDGTYAPDFALKATDQIRSGTYFERGDILVAKITPSFENGKQALATKLPTPFGFATTEVIPLRPRHRGHDRRLLFSYLLHPDIRHYVAERMEGSTGRQRVPPEVLLDLPFPEFALEEQRVISDALEVIQYSITVETEAAEVTTSLKRAAMQQLFTRGLNNEARKETEIGPMPESWEAPPVASLAEVKGGKRMPKGVALTVENTGRPYVRVTDFRNHSVNEEEIRFVPKGYEDRISRYTISMNDVYISIAGTIGLVGQVPEILDGANLTENAAKITPISSEVATRFLMYALASSTCQSQIARATGRNAQPKLALARLEQIEIPLPPTIDAQHEIVAILDAIDCKIDLHLRKRAVLDELFKALLHKLMTGEISVTDLDFSPFVPRTYEQEIGKEFDR